MKFTSLLLLILSLNVSAQVADFLPTQKTISKPFGLPVKIDLDGKINFFTGDRDLVFGPGVQLAYDSSFVQYSIPTITSEFELRPPDAGTGWMEFKRIRYDYGAGLIALLKQSFRLGLAPYKGAKLTMRRLKTEKDALTPGNISLPRELSEITKWYDNDQGTFQTYGGIQVYAGFDLGPINLMSATMAWQNQFIVAIQKTSKGIILSLTEEKLDRRSLMAGIEVTYVTATEFQGKQLTANFTLDFANPLHHELYRSAIKGKLTELQEKLPSEKRSLRWEGHDLSAYWGIPWLVAHTVSRGHYQVTEDKQEYFLEVIQNKRAGLLVHPAFHQKFVYHNPLNILMMWTTDMKKSSPKDLKKHFFGPARAVGFKGFEISMNEKNYGTVIGEVGIVITKEDVESFESLDDTSLISTLHQRCEELALECAQDGKAVGIIRKFSVVMKKDWEEKKKILGLLLVQEPALLYSLLKESGLVKEAYFKFLSDRFQSLEGLTRLAL